MPVTVFAPEGCVLVEHHEYRSNTRGTTWNQNKSAHGCKPGVILLNESALSPAVIGDTDLVYHTENLSDGTIQLIITDPSSSVSQILLQSGDKVADGAQSSPRCHSIPRLRLDPDSTKGRM